jgi:hypothetical protein
MTRPVESCGDAWSSVSAANKRDADAYAASLAPEEPAMPWPLAAAVIFGAAAVCAVLLTGAVYLTATLSVALLRWII